MEYTRSAFMDEPAPYRVCVHGRVSERWVGELSDMKPTVFVHPNGVTETELKGVVTDQAALLGIINLLYDLGNPILRVERLDPEQASDQTREG